MKSQNELRIRGGVWKREYGEVAVRIPLQFPDAVINSGFVVSAGTRGAIFTDGKLSEEVTEASGFLPQRVDQSLIEKLIGLKGGGKQVEVALVVESNFSVPIHLYQGIALRDGSEMEVSLELVLRVSDVRLIWSQLLSTSSTDVLSAGDLASGLMGPVQSAVVEVVGKWDAERAVSERSNKEALESSVRERLSESLTEMG
ncbi:MAG: hypothetical protein AAF357_18750, partial [Verrucomicrobiota bacterium]